MDELDRNEPCPHCGRFANCGVTVDAVIIRDKVVLLIKRGVEPHKGLWATPGGYVEWDESAEDIVRREVKEETGLNVKKLKQIGVYSSPDRHPKQAINILYAVDVEPGDDAEDAQWFSLDSLPDKLAFDHKQNIAEAKKLLGLGI